MEGITVQDRGWAWLVCLSSFVGNFILGGIKRSFGLALPILKKYFSTSTSLVSLVASTLEGMYYIVGPLVSFVANRFGLRLTSILGSIITSVALLLSTFATKVYVLLFTYSVLGGTGLGFIYLPASVACNYYFQRRRGLATGISKCGYSIGGMIFPLLANFVLENLGWKAMFYMFSLASLLNCLFGTLFEPVCSTETRMRYSKLEEQELSNCIDDSNENENMHNMSEAIRCFQNEEQSTCNHDAVLEKKVEMSIIKHIRVF